MHYFAVPGSPIKSKALSVTKVEIAISTNLLFPIYLGIIVFLPTFPPQIYVNTDLGDIFHPVGIGFFSALIKAFKAKEKVFIREENFFS